MDTALAPGLLLAAPSLGDPNFDRSVVLLVDHDDEGAIGWVLNGRPLVPVSRLLRDTGLAEEGAELTTACAEPIRLGGPVMPSVAWLLCERQPGQPDYPGQFDLGRGYVVTSARDAIAALGREGEPRRFRLFLGYAGWGPGQLEGEIRAGSWLPAALDHDLLLEAPIDTLWDAAYQRATGLEPGAFTTGGRGQA